MLDRRGFLGTAPLALGLLACKGRSGTGDSAPPRGDRASEAAVALGVQLYTVREPMSEDPDGTLAALAEMGYRNVELAGLYGMTPAAMRTKLDAAGLVAVSSHNSLQEIRGDWERALAGAHTLGQSLIVCPSIGGDERDAEGLARVADDFNRAGEAARAAGLAFGYHNHGWELADLGGGRSGMDVLLERCDPDLVAWQMDVFWAVDGGAEPMALLEAHRARVTSLHVKDRAADGRMVDVGDGVIDFARILARASELGTRWAFVEHDRPADPLRSVQRSFEHLRSPRS